MKINSDLKKFQTALVSAPWPLYNRPSIQLGTLKAWLENSFTELRVDTYHFYLNIAEETGYPLYMEIGENSWLAETVYAALLYPERNEKIAELFSKLSKKNNQPEDISFGEICKRTEHASNRLIEETSWEKYLYVGFSVCLCQLTSSLYFIRKIKEKYPDLPVIAGGSMVSGLDPEELFSAFPDIDIIVNGEGERPLSEITEQLLSGRKPNNMLPVAGAAIKPESACSNKSYNQIAELDILPCPDFTDYFKTLESLPASRRFFPTLPVEMSRGCWWRRKSDKGHSGCSFCNLNLQWNGYRSKSPEKMISEIDFLTTKHKLLSINLMDNLIPLKKSTVFFKNLAASGKDFQIFCEIRAITPFEDLMVMKKAGVKYVQVGIEALSSNLLEKMNKGTTAIENLAVMKNCEALDIENNANLIICFPGSDGNDIEETLNALEYAAVFRPLKTVRFMLGLGSAVMKSSKEYGIRSVRNNPKYNILFPEALVSSIRLTSQAYVGDNLKQHKLWQPVVKRVKAWEKTYSRLHSGSATRPILSYQDGGSFMIIRKRQLDRESESHRLEGTSRKIYLFCEKIRTFKEIRERFTTFSGQAVFSFLSMMVEKRLMFSEDDKYLSLASGQKKI